MIYDRITENAKKIYGENLPDIVSERIEAEYKTLDERKIEEIEAAEELMEALNGIVLIPDEHTASSYIAYLLNINFINPLPAHYLCGNCKHTEFFDTGYGADLSDKECPHCGESLSKEGYNIDYKEIIFIRYSYFSEIVKINIDDIPNMGLAFGEVKYLNKSETQMLTISAYPRIDYSYKPYLEIESRKKAYDEFCFELNHYSDICYAKKLVDSLKLYCVEDFAEYLKSFDIDEKTSMYIAYSIGRGSFVEDNYRTSDKYGKENMNLLSSKNLPNEFFELICQSRRGTLKNDVISTLEWLRKYDNEKISGNIENLSRAELHIRLPEMNQWVVNEDLSGTDDEIYEAAIKNNLYSIGVIGFKSLETLPSMTCCHLFKNKMLFGYEGMTEKNSIVILVKKQEGLKNLYAIISNEINSIMKREELTKYRDGLLYGCPIDGSLYSAAKNNVDIKEMKEITDFYDYFEVSPHTEKEIVEKMVAICDYYGKTIVAAGEMKYSYKDMYEAFSYLGEEKATMLIENANEIADGIEEVNLYPRELPCHDIFKYHHELKEIAFKNLYEIYGGNVNEEIVHQLSTELDSIKTSTDTLVCIFARELVMQAKKEKISISQCSYDEKPLLSFLLGISDINPLKPHYLCVKCHNFEFISDINFGFEAEDKYCPICNGLYKKDGYNLQYSLAQGCFEKSILFWFETVAKKPIFKYFVEKYGNNKAVVSSSYNGLFFISDEKKEITDYTPVRYEDGIPVSHYNSNDISITTSICIVRNERLKLLHALDEKFGYPDINLNDPNIFKMLVTENKNGLINITERKLFILAKSCPKSFSDIVKFFGDSDLHYDENIEIKEIIADRDDLMLRLLEYGTEKKEAYEIVEKIKYGDFSDENVNLLKSNGIPDSCMNQLENLYFSYGKAFGIFHAKIAIKLMYYKLHHELSFYTEFLNTYCNDLKHLDYNTALKFVADYENLPETDYDLQDDYYLMKVVVEIHEKGIEIKVNNPDLKSFKFIEDSGNIKVVEK